jgi:hypothetical protein
MRATARPPAQTRATWDRLAHASEDDPSALAGELDRHEAGACLEAERVALQRAAEDERRAEHGMSGEGQLARGREDPKPAVAPRARR